MIGRGVTWLLPLVLLGHQSDVLAAADRSVKQQIPRIQQVQARPGTGPSLPAELKTWADAAESASQRGESKEALRYQNLVVEWAEKNLSNDWYHGYALSQLSAYLADTGKVDQALASAHKAANILRINLQIASERNDDNRRYPIQFISQELALTLRQMGAYESELGRPLKAVEPLQEAVKMAHSLATQNLKQYRLLAKCILDLSRIQFNLGQREKALQTSNEGVVAAKKYFQSFPNDFEIYADALNVQSVTLAAVGRRVEGLQTSEKIVDLYKQKMSYASPSHLDGYRRALNSLGIAYVSTGRFSDSIPISEETIAVLRKMQANPVFSRRSVDYALLLAYGTLAESSLKAKDAQVYDKAFKEGMATYLELKDKAQDLEAEKAVLGFQLQIATYYLLVKKDPQRAITMFQEIIHRARSSQIGLSFPAFIGTSLVNMASSYKAISDFANSFKTAKEAKAFFYKLAALNPTYNIGLMQSLYVLNNSCLALPECSQSPSIIRELLALEAGYLLDQIVQLPQAKRESFREAIGPWDGFVYQAALASPKGAALALLTRLNRQGFLLEIQRRQALLARSGPHRNVFEQIQSIKAQASAMNLSAQDRQRLVGEQERLEFELNLLLPGIRFQVVEPSQVAKVLPSGGALVEFQRFLPDPGGYYKPYPPPHYLALVLKPDGNTRALSLGSAAKIDAAIAHAVSASADPQRQAEAPERLAAVSQLLLKPLQAELAGVRELFVSPDGELNRLPFAALPMATAAGPTLGESVQLRLLTTGRELVRLQQPIKAGTASTLITNPDFGPPDPTIKEQWQPLRGTAAEAEKLAPLLKPQALISGRQATTAVVLQQKSPRILHIATHGFFLADQPGQAQGEQGFEVMQRSGLVFAGANQRSANPADDGRLTASEATAMNLEGTELVTLSACETALGGVRSGEGVYGLQRALAVAGARSTLLSLWKVDDDRTATFLEKFYQRLKAGEGRAEALRNTQAEYRKSTDTNFNDVRVWGAFQLSGDWRPIRGW